jgi:hypothetical protein
MRIPNDDRVGRAVARKPLYRDPVYDGAGVGGEQCGHADQQQQGENDLHRHFRVFSAVMLSAAQIPT